jgi:DNA recombination protein RmuC
MDNWVILVGIGVLVLTSIFLNWRHWSEMRRSREKDQSFLMLQQQIDNLRKNQEDGRSNLVQTIQQQLEKVVDQMIESNKNVGDRLDNAGKVVLQVQGRLGELQEAQKRIYDVGKDIASLQEILKAPKLRGGLGEFFLGDLLGQIIPPEFFTLQYRFKSGEKVDAVVRLGESLVPVDSKFPLENFKRLIEAQEDEEKKKWRKVFGRDVKKHIDDIAQKYILPDEGTFEFALMYIPAENVYYETIIKDDHFGDEKSISNYALEKKVIPVSPNSFYAYLQAIVMGLRGLRIESSTQEILQNLGRLEGDLKKFHEDFRVLGNHLTNAQTKYGDADRKLSIFTDRLNEIESPVTPSAIPEKPSPD